jgi:hypothetical protein
MEDKHELENTLVNLKDFKEALDDFVTPEGWSLSNLPTHFWETLGECINDIERYITINDKTKMLEKIKADRPNQNINEVIDFKKNIYGFYDVKVDMEIMFFDNTKILHMKCTLPYPSSDYEKLTEDQQLKYRMNNPPKF